MEGVDISEHQEDIPAAWFDQWDFAIIRGHSGYRDDYYFQRNWANAKGRTRRGIYGYVVGQRDPGWQAVRLLELTAGDPPELFYWCDAEDPSVVLPAVQQHLSTLPAAQRGLYSYVPFLTGPLGSDASLQQYPLWIAGYGRNDGNRYPLNPAPPWDYVIHQYTSWNGLDRNYAATLDWAGVAAAPTTTSDKRKKSTMWIAILVGIDGLVHAYMFAGVMYVRELAGEPRGAYGIPQEALDSGLYIQRVDTIPAHDGQGTMWDALMRVNANMQISPGTVTTEVVTDPKQISTADLWKELGSRIGV